MSVTLTFQLNGLEYVDYMTHGLSLAAIETYARDIAQYSHAAIVNVTYTEGFDLEDIPAKGDGAYADVRLMAKILLRDADTDKLYGAIIRAPKVDIFDDTADGLRVKPAIGIAIAAKYSLMAGSTLIFQSGALCGSTK